MKARTPIPLTSKEQQELRRIMVREMESKIENERRFVCAVTEAMIFAALNETFGFGTERLTRLSKAADAIAVDVQDYLAADIAEYKLIERMRQLGMDELADIINALGNERERWHEI